MSALSVSDKPTTGRRLRSSIPRIAAIIAFGTGMLSLFFAIFPDAWVAIMMGNDGIGYLLYSFNISPNLAAAVIWTLLSGALATRKRLAWWLCIVLSSPRVLEPLRWIVIEYSSSTAEEMGNLFETYIFNPEYLWLVWGPTIIALIFCAVLVWAYPEFYAKIRRGGIKRFLLVYAIGLLITVTVGWVVAKMTMPDIGNVEAFQAVLSQLTGNLAPGGLEELQPNMYSFPPGEAAAVVVDILGALASLCAFTVLWRAQTQASLPSEAEEIELRKLMITSPNPDSLDYFATRRDRALIFSPNRKAAISYRVEAGVSLAGGDPIGAEAEWPEAIRVWQRDAKEYGWQAAVLGASERGAESYVAQKMSAFHLGDEAVIYLQNFSLRAPAMKSVQQAVRRAQKAGVTVQMRLHRTVSEVEWQRYRDLVAEWRDTDSERGFSMALSRLGDPADGDCVLLEASDAQGQTVCLMSFAPWGNTGLSLDLMRRDPQAPNGVIELMVSTLAQEGGQFGVQKFSLNFAVFRSAFEEGARIGAGPLLRLWRKLLLFVSRWFQLEALYRSNVKFLPEWNPRFMCYTDSRNLPKIGFASGIAEGYISIPGRRTEVARSGTFVAEEIENFSQEYAQQFRARQQRKIPQQSKVRIDKAEAMRAAGIDPYPVAIPPSHSVAELLDNTQITGAPVENAQVTSTQVASAQMSSAQMSSAQGTEATIAGRVLLLRKHGGVIFVKLRDISGDIQLILERDALGPELKEFSRWVDLGDLIEVTGTLGTSRSGEISLVVASWRMIGKCLQPMPNKWLGLNDPEAKVRQRYLDLAISEEARELAMARSIAIRSFRDSLARRGYLEVETPILQQVHGGANARPFTTHMNAYNLDLYLRIAPELYLKRLCVGGMEKVFELGRTFRNEGVSYKHNPEFTMLEAYEAHGDYDTMLKLCREMIQEAAIAIHGEAVAVRVLPDGRKEKVDISGEWPVKTLNQAVSEKLGVEITPETDLATLQKLCQENEVPYLSSWDTGEVILEMYERLVEEDTLQPTFYKDFPLSVSPLTRSHRSLPGVTEKWDLVGFGMELGTAYSELTDPIEQRRRLTEQSLLAAQGSPEAMELDEDFLHALDYAMPPTGGLGIGVDRVIMLLTGYTIREALPFPLAKVQ